MEALMKIQDMKKINHQAKQCFSDVRSIWSTVNPLLLIDPNALTSEDLIDKQYYLPPKKLLIKNKDKEHCEQEPHIQASTIKTKLISFKKFMSFLRDRKIYVGLNFENIKTIISTCDSCKVTLSNLCKDREHSLKKFKSGIFISSNLFKEYGCSEHITNICKVTKEIQNDPKVFVERRTTARDIRNYLMLLCAIQIVSVHQI